MPMSQKEFELALVRVAERFPTRIGACGRMELLDGSRCIVGEVFAPLFGDNFYTMPSSYACRHVFGSNFFSAFRKRTELEQLVSAAFFLNDTGCQWGYIPYLLGLVPGEQPPVLPLVQPDTVTVPEPEVAHAAV